MSYPDGEYVDFRNENFRYQMSNKRGYCYTWFTPDDIEIHSKRLSEIHIDVNEGGYYVLRYNEKFYLTPDTSVDMVNKKS